MTFRVRNKHRLDVKMSKVGNEGEIEDHQTHVLDLAEANERPNQTPVWQIFSQAGIS